MENNEQIQFIEFLQKETANLDYHECVQTEMMENIFHHYKKIYNDDQLNLRNFTDELDKLKDMGFIEALTNDNMVFKEDHSNSLGRSFEWIFFAKTQKLKKFDAISYQQEIKKNKDSATIYNVTNHSGSVNFANGDNNQQKISNSNSDISDEFLRNLISQINAETTQEKKESKIGDFVKSHGGDTIKIIALIAGLFQ